VSMRMDGGLPNSFTICFSLRLAAYCLSSAILAIELEGWLGLTLGGMVEISKELVSKMGKFLDDCSLDGMLPSPIALASLSVNLLELGFLSTVYLAYCYFSGESSSSETTAFWFSDCFCFIFGIFCFIHIPDLDSLKN
jgi:hypothetical protein